MRFEFVESNIGSNPCCQNDYNIAFIVVHSHQRPAVVGAQGNGKGIALLPRFIVDEEIAAGRLVEVLSDWTAPQIWLTLYYPPYERLPLRVATFSDFFEAWVRTSNPSESGSGFQ